MTLPEMMRSDRWAGVSPGSTAAAPRPVHVRRKSPAPSSAPASRGLVITQGGKRETVSVPTERFGS